RPPHSSPRRPSGPARGVPRRALQLRLGPRPRDGRRPSRARVPGRDPHRRPGGIPPAAASLLPDVPDGGRASGGGRAPAAPRAPGVVGGAPLRLREKSRAREYSAPRFYEIAFDLNRKGEVDFLAHCFKRFSRRRVRRVVDIACGTGPHLMRLADRGYMMSGLDLSPRNIQFLRERFAAKGYQGELVVGDMTDFR